MSQPLIDHVHAVLRRVAPDLDPTTLDPAAALVEQADLDSMDFQNLLAGLATRLNIDIPEPDTAALRSIDDLVSYLAGRGVRSPP